jgi:serine/threonine protein kinase
MIKETIRKQFIEKRKLVEDKAGKSEIICRKLLNSDLYKHSECIGVYASKEDEVDTILGKLKNAELDFPSNIEVSECFKNFLRKVLEKDYLKRYITKDALNDHWIKGWDIINEENEKIFILGNFITILIMNNSPKFNRYINL